MALKDAHKDGNRVHEFLSGLLVKAVGATAGATLAAWWRQPTRWLLQIVAGAWTGAVTGGWLIDFMGWPISPDYLLMAGSIMGLTGFTLFEALLKTSPLLLKTLRGFVAARVGVKVDEP